MRIKAKLSLILFAVFFLQACAGFHLRNTVSLPEHYQKLQILGVSQENELFQALELALEGAGGEVLGQANAKINISNIREGKRVVAYTRERKARVYLLYLKLNYDISLSRNSARNSARNSEGKTLTQRINLDKTFVYDANFALGKAEEETQIRENLYKEAARLILLSLKYRE